MKALIFDFDGVIVDSEKYWPDTGPSFFASIVGASWGPADQRKLKGHSLEGTHAILVRDYGVTLSLLEYERLLTEIVFSIYNERSMLMPHVIDLLERLDVKNVTMGIASSSKRAWIDMAMRRLQVDRFFPVICTGDDVPGRAKPHPDVYLLAAEHLGVEAPQCIAIEDSTNGITAAKAAGMTCIALHTEENTDLDLSAADIHIHAFTELDDARVHALLA